MPNPIPLLHFEKLFDCEDVILWLQCHRKLFFGTLSLLRGVLKSPYMNGHEFNWPQPWQTPEAVCQSRFWPSLWSVQTRDGRGYPHPWYHNYMQIQLHKCTNYATLCSKQNFEPLPGMRVQPVSTRWAEWRYDLTTEYLAAQICLIKYLYGEIGTTS